MIGLGVCLLVRPKQAWLAAVAAVLLLVLHAIMLQHLGGGGDMGDAMIVILGRVGTALFGFIPFITLLITAGGLTSKDEAK
jgi:hypothetical protein